MPLPTNYVGTVLSWPLRITPGSKGDFQRADNRAPVNCVPSMIVRQTFTDPATVDDDAIGSDPGPNTTTIAFVIDGALASGGVATFPTPCAVTATVTHASSVVTQTIDLTGKDIHGRTITETLTIPATGTSQVVSSKQAFWKITAASQTAAGNASTNTVKLGTSKIFGLAFKCSSIELTGEMQDAAIPGTRGTVVAASTAAGSDLRGTYTPNGTPNGSIDWNIWYITDDLSSIT